MLIQIMIRVLLVGMTGQKKRETHPDNDSSWEEPRGQAFTIIVRSASSGLEGNPLLPPRAY